MTNNVAVPGDVDLSIYKGRNVYYNPNYGGNNGDTLIEYGDRITLRKAGVNLVSDPSEADAICIRGGGFLRYYYGGGGVESLVRHYLEYYPKAHIIQFPASFTDETKLHSVFGRNGDRVTVYVRERYSWDIIQRQQPMAGCQIKLAHDSAFQLTDRVWQNEYLSKPVSKNILIVERRDIEAITDSANDRLPSAGRLRQMLPSYVKSWAKKNIFGPRLMKNASDTVFAKHALDKAKQIYPDLFSLNEIHVRAGDISLPGFYSMPFFIREIEAASAVVSTRLHVGILAAILGKPTIQVSGSYHKINGIYEMSMEKMSNVQLMQLEDIYEKNEQ